MTKVFEKDGNRITVADDANLADWPGYTEEALIGGEARALRNKLLQESDWTQLVDAPVNKAEWAEYRSALRDLPGPDGFTADCTWPIKPE